MATQTQEESMLERYAGFRPTSFDGHIPVEGQEDWFIAPVSRTRDSGALDNSNFEVMEKLLEEVDSEGETFEVRRFGHWGPGWYEIILVKPDSKAFDVAVDCAHALDDYPVLDEMDLGEKEHEEQSEAWDNFYASEFEKQLRAKHDPNDLLWACDIDSDALREMFDEVADDTNVYWETSSDGQTIDVDRVAKATVPADFVRLVIGTPEWTEIQTEAQAMHDSNPDWRPPAPGQQSIPFKD